MAKELLMGNAAIGLGAIKAGVNLVSGYPGTPSTEIFRNHREGKPRRYLSRMVRQRENRPGSGCWRVLYWRPFHGHHEAGGAECGLGPLMSLNYLSVKGGMVVVVADDPGPISLKRNRIPGIRRICENPGVRPLLPEEAYEMIQDPSPGRSGSTGL